MAKNRYINTKFWDDNYIIELDPIEKLLYLYFMTNTLTNIAGIYEIPLRRISFDTGIDKDMVLKIIERFSEDKKIYFIKGWLIICNFPKHQQYSKSPKIKLGIEACIEEIPEEILKEMNTLSIPYTYSLNYLIKYNSNSNSNTKKKKNLQLAKLLVDILLEEKNLRKPDGDYQLENLFPAQTLIKDIKHDYKEQTKKEPSDEIIQSEFRAILRNMDDFNYKNASSIIYITKHWGQIISKIK